jgi:hypothetical protein
MKFENKLVLYDNKYYKSNGLSPYLFILKIEKQNKTFKINYIDRLGNIDTILTTKHYLYRDFEVLDIELNKHLTYEFIKNLF